MASPSKPRIGHIDDVEIGSEFRTRADVARAGLHRDRQRGIDGNATTGAAAIVSSGGYATDMDFGSFMIYTGEGRGNQTLTAGNAALKTSYDGGLPVRVIRALKPPPRGGRHQTSPGYSYDGLYRVTRYGKYEIDDAEVYLFLIEAIAGMVPDKYEPRVQPSDFVEHPLLDEDLPQKSMPEGNPAPERILSTALRIKRQRNIAQWIYDHYERVCQACGDESLHTPTGRIAEAAHIRALGGDAAGSDDVNNVLCLCPTCHRLFDRGGLIITDELKVARFNMNTGGDYTITSNLLVRAPHAPARESLAWHRDHHGKQEPLTIAL